MAGPHDALFKLAFSDVEEAAPLLRSVLPNPLTELIDWSTLRVMPGSYVDETLSNRYSDLLYSARIGGETVLIYLLVEHQSTVFRLMGFRMLRYVVRIWEGWLRDAPNGGGLPKVVPVVIYAGEDEWDAPTDVESLVRGDTDAWTPRMSFILDDLTRLSEADLAGRNLGVFAELVVRALTRLRTSSAPLGELRSWLPLLERLLLAKNGLERFRALIEYLASVANFEPEALPPIVRQLGPAAEETAVTAAERLRQQGFERGLEQARIEMTLLQLRMKFGESLPQDILARVESGTEADFAAWSGRILTANRLEEVFVDLYLD